MEKNEFRALAIFYAVDDPVHIHVEVLVHQSVGIVEKHLELIQQQVKHPVCVQTVRLYEAKYIPKPRINDDEQVR